MVLFLSFVSVIVFSELISRQCNLSFPVSLWSVTTATPGSDLFSSTSRSPFKISIAIYRCEYQELALCLVTFGSNGRSSYLHQMLAKDLKSVEPEFQPSLTFLLRWYSKSSLVYVPLPKPPVKLPSSPPHFSRHRLCIIAHHRRKLGFSVVGLSQADPFCFSSWPINEFGGPSVFSSKPMSVLKVKLLSLDFLSRHITSFGRGLRDGILSTWEQGLLDILQLAYGTILAWLRFDISILLPYQISWMNRYLDLIGRGQLSSQVSISLVRLWNSGVGSLVQDISLGLLWKCKRVKLLNIVPSILIWFWWDVFINPRQSYVSCCDFENLRFIHLHLVENLLMQLSSSMERLVWSFSSFMEAIVPPWPPAVQLCLRTSVFTLSLSYAEEIGCLTSMRSKVLDPPLTSYGLSTTTIHHHPDWFVDMVSTHHLLACGIAHSCSCLRVMDLMSKYPILLSYAFINALHLVVLSYIWAEPSNFVVRLII